MLLPFKAQVLQALYEGTLFNCRLVPRRGAGPGLRSGGQEIDEYLMRLLYAGSANATEAAFCRNEVCTLAAHCQSVYFVRQ